MAWLQSAMIYPFSWGREIPIQFPFQFGKSQWANLGHMPIPGTDPVRGHMPTSLGTSPTREDHTMDTIQQEWRVYNNTQQHGWYVSLTSYLLYRTVHPVRFHLHHKAQNQAKQFCAILSQDCAHPPGVAVVMLCFVIGQIHAATIQKAIYVCTFLQVYFFHFYWLFKLY